MNKTPFNESFVSKHVAPECGNDDIEHFDYDAVERHLGEVPEINKRDLEGMAKVIGLLLEWLTASNLNDKRCLRSMGMRVLAAAWVINPARFQNRSLHNIATQLGCGPNNIAPLTADFSRRFKITNKLQSHNWRNNKCRSCGKEIEKDATSCPHCLATDAEG